MIIMKINTYSFVKSLSLFSIDQNLVELLLVPLLVVCHFLHSDPIVIPLLIILVIHGLVGVGVINGFVCGIHGLVYVGSHLIERQVGRFIVIKSPYEFFTLILAQRYNISERTVVASSS